MASWGSCDLRKLRDLHKRMGTAIQEINAFHTGLLDTMMNGLLNDVKDATPFKTRHLKRNWFITPTQKTESGVQAEIYNNVEYASWVENGHRIVRDGQTRGFVEGRYMLRDGLNDLQQAAPGFIKAKNEAFLRRMMEDE